MANQLDNTIFYADDDLDDLDFFKEAADEINMPVYLFEQGNELLHTLNNPPPNASVVFLDLNMPIKSGFDVLREMSATETVASIPVIIFTTSNNPNDIELSKKLGARLYIRKPTSVGSLRKAIDHVMSIDWANYTTSDSNFVYKN